MTRPPLLCAVARRGWSFDRSTTSAAKLWPPLNTPRGSVHRAADVERPGRIGMPVSRRRPLPTWRPSADLLRPLRAAASRQRPRPGPRTRTRPVDGGASPAERVASRPGVGQTWIIGRHRRRRPLAQRAQCRARVMDDFRLSPRGMCSAERHAIMMLCWWSVFNSVSLFPKHRLSTGDKAVGDGA